MIGVELRLKSNISTLTTGSGCLRYLDGILGSDNLSCVSWRMQTPSLAKVQHFLPVIPKQHERK